jgi:hypothetical protein
MPKRRDDAYARPRLSYGFSPRPLRSVGTELAMD